jgi:2-methylcitrate dehydratase PrpD
VAEKGGLTPDEITSVRVETYSLAAQLQDRSPTNTLAGKFSVPFAVATTLINGSSGVMSFTLDQVRRAEIQAFADRVEVVEDPALTAMMPDYRPARVIVTLTDGTVLTAETKTNRGDTEDPYDDTDLDEKYVELTARVWTAETARAVYDVCFAIDRTADVLTLTKPMDVAPLATPLAQAGE